MTRKNSKVLEAVLETQKTMGSLNEKVGVVVSKMETIETNIQKYENVLYGDPQKMGEGGLIHKQGEQDLIISGLTKRVDHLRSTFVLIWTGIFAIIQVAFSAIKHFFAGNN